MTHKYMCIPYNILRQIKEDGNTNVASPCPSLPSLAAPNTFKRTIEAMSHGKDVNATQNLSFSGVKPYQTIQDYPSLIGYDFEP